MIIFEYLFWILFIGFCNFVAIRLMWLYEQIEGHLFWKKQNAITYYVGATILFLVMAVIILQSFHIIYLLILLLGEYALIAGAVVKVSDRGIMANAFMARWPDIVHAKKISAGREIAIVTNRSWQWMRLQVPSEKETAFRKMLAAKGIAIVEEEVVSAETKAQTAPPAAPVEEKKEHNSEASITAAPASS
jgi:hypothetical protein